MPTGRKVGGVAIIVVSALMFVGCLAAVTGVWFLRAFIYNEVRQVATRVLELTAGVDSGLGRVEDRLTATLQHTQAVRERSQGFAARDLSETALNSAVRGVVDQIRDELSPAIERATDAADTVRDRIEALNSTIRLANRMPGVNLPTIQPAEIAFVNEAMSTARTHVAALNARVAGARLDTRQEVADTVARQTANIDSVVQPTQQRVAAMRAPLAALEASIDALPGWVDARLLLPMALLSTLVFAWLALGQLALGWVGWLIAQDRLHWRAGRLSPPPAPGEAMQ